MGSNPLRFGGLQGDITGLGDLNFTWTGSASVGGNKTWTINNATTAAFANNWSGNSGWNVTKAGTGGLVFNGNLTGTGVGLVVSAGTMSLNGSANSYSGATTVNGGALFVDGVVTNSAITVNNGGRIGGLGSVGNVTFNAGAGLAYNVANVAQGGDGLTAASFTGAGVGGFTIFLGGAAAGFDDSANYTWTVLSSADVASISLSGITLDTSGFGQSFTGEFSVTKDAGSLHVNYIGSIVPEPSSAALLAGFGILGFTMTRRRRG
jgi:autotransporter-associated beta strand protein